METNHPCLLIIGEPITPKPPTTVRSVGNRWKAIANCLPNQHYQPLVKANFDSKLPPNALLSVAAENIKSITFWAFNGQFTLDNLRFGF
ncbi:hypothetical protein [Cylindrospermum stagnale]|uniref:hypothetical protein n=1 Tax=Cylindrospermum stagnale TaxID=142864 RepID=UPI0002DC86F2